MAVFMVYNLILFGKVLSPGRSVLVVKIQFLIVSAKPSIRVQIPVTVEILNRSMCMSGCLGKAQAAVIQITYKIMPKLIDMIIQANLIKMSVRFSILKRIGT